MFILENLNQLEKAVMKARNIKPVVRMLSFGVYVVRGNSGNYTVECRRNEQGEKIVTCDCKGALKNLVCYHAASAIELHSTIAKHRAIH